MNQEYKTYIHSKEWFAKREEAFNFHNKECKKCGITKKLHVHHKTYKRFKNEDIKIDLVPLCRRCHKQVHKFCKRRNIDLYHGTEQFLDGKIKPSKRGKKKPKKDKKYPDNNPHIKYFSYRWRYSSNDLDKKTLKKMVGERESNRRRIERRNGEVDNIDYEKLKEMYNL